MQFKRQLYNKLLNWKVSEHRKPLILRGARQVGKTTLIRHFSENYSYFIELNLEKTADRLLMERTDNINDLLNIIFLEKGIDAEWKECLLFIDEIQRSSTSIQLLRYFYEEAPQLHVIAAGSLLEFSFGENYSFPVGRVSFLSLHPLSFQEFLDAKNSVAAKELNVFPIKEYAHETLKKLFHEYAIIGGMPEIISHFIDTGNISSLITVYNELWRSYKDDVEKYGKNASDRKIIRHIMNTAALEGDRIKFEGFGNSAYRSREVGEAIKSLDLARVIMLIYPVTNMQVPLFPNLKKSPRLQFLDGGLLNHALRIQHEMIGIKDLNPLHKGRIIHQLVSQELISLQDDPDYRPHFWVREKKSTNAEVDVVYSYKNIIIPIEIKSGATGKLRSLHQFMDRASHFWAVRCYAGKFTIEKTKTIAGKEFYLMNLPYYLISKIDMYLDYFIKNHTELEELENA